MPSTLPSQIVVVVESIIREDLGIGISANVAGVVADALPGEAHIRLSAKGNANFLVAGEAKVAGGIARDAVVPTYTCEADAPFIDDGGRERVDPTRAQNLGWIGTVAAARHLRDRSCKITAGARARDTNECIRNS